MKAMMANLQKTSFTLIHSVSFKVASPKHSSLMWNSLMICNPSNELDWIPLRGRGRREKIKRVSLPKRSELNSVKAEGFSALWASANQLLISSFDIITFQLNFWMITRFWQDKKVPLQLIHTLHADEWICVHGVEKLQKITRNMQPRHPMQCLLPNWISRLRWMKLD